MPAAEEIPVEELIDEMAKRAKTPELAAKLKAARESGFQFDKVTENLAKAGAGQNTRADS